MLSEHALRCCMPDYAQTSKRCVDIQIPLALVPAPVLLALRLQVTAPALCLLPGWSTFAGA